MRLESITIEGFRSLEKVTLENLGQVNVLVGQNNSGKSAVLNFLKLIQTVAIAQTGNAQLGVNFNEISTFRKSIQEFRFSVNALMDKGEIEDILKSNFSEQELLKIEQMKMFSEVYFEVILNSRNVQCKKMYTKIRGKMMKIVEFVDGPNHHFDFSKLLEEDFSMKDLDLEISNHEKIEIFSPKFSATGSTRSFSFYEKLNTHFANFFLKMFFFDSSRHCEPSRPAQKTLLLSSNGLNLVQVVATILSNDTEERISNFRNFIRQAFPNIGFLQTILNDSSANELTFLAQNDTLRTRIDEMGGGVEQLLMVATALHTTPNDHIICLEEPESHLHPGAQRYLLEKLIESGRQVFITTHSPVFVNSKHPDHRVYRVTQHEGRSSISPAVTPAELGQALEEIGSKLSDVLLSDAVLFVEGPSDEPVFSAWADTMEWSIAGQNIRVLETEGSELVHRDAPIRSGVLEKLSTGTKLPHLFVIDRDQRTPEEIAKLQTALDNKMHVLERRELENYLLVPRAILAMLRADKNASAEIQQKRASATEAEIQTQIVKAADGLYDTMLIKRIKQALGRIEGGFLNRDEVKQAIPKARASDLDAQIAQMVQARIKPLLETQRLKKVVKDEKKRLDKEWLDPANHLQIASGAEILEQVLKNYGINFNKVRDGQLIAKQMLASEIPDEIKTLLERIRNLTARD
jgi:predicted ATP-dependent endonuclease of OLD family